MPVGTMDHSLVGFLLICCVATVFGVFGRRLSQTIVTAPMVFIGLGALLTVSDLIVVETAEALLDPVAETALVVLLFLDASQVNLRALKERHVWPMRMLLIGLPLAIILGTGAGVLFFPDWSIFALILVAAIFSPTDAALGQAVVSNKAVPERVRRSLTVESGLNDGLALPFILLFASLTAGTDAQDVSVWTAFAAKQIILGPVVGIAVGWIGGQLLIIAKNKNWTAEAYEGIGALAMAGAAYLTATMIGGNGFISAFVAGLAFGAVVKDRCKFIFEFGEGEGQLLTWAAFLLLGAALVPDAIQHLSVTTFVFILLSLFVIRPLAIWVSLVGTDADPTTRFFFGWFGPRGLATALFALLIVESISMELGESILHLAINLVWISAVLHGLSAAPAASWYAKYVSNSATTPRPDPAAGSPNDTI